jgi:AraC-like DNA-binding protein
MSALTLCDASADVRVSGYLIRCLVELLQTRGVGPEVLLGSATAASYLELAESRVPLQHYQMLLRRAIEISSDPAFGLHSALHAGETTFGMMSPLVAHAQSLRHAIGLATRFHAVICDAARIEVSEHTGIALLRCKLHPAMQPEMVEQIVCGLLRLLQAFGCTRRDIRVVSFQYRRPSHYRAYDAAFGGAERFERTFTGIELASEALDRPHLRWQPELQSILLEHAERAVEQLSRPSTLEERVRALLLQRAEQDLPSVAEVARELGISERSLRRRLELEGTSYRQLAERTQCDAACSLLRDPEQTIQTVAHTLGFASQASFHRAFTRWTATTPLEYRETKTKRAV